MTIAEAIASSSPELLAAWEMRPCFICEMAGSCSHREPDVEMAYIEAFAKRRIVQENQLARLRALGRMGIAA